MGDIESHTGPRQDFSIAVLGKSVLYECPAPLNHLLLHIVLPHKETKVRDNGKHNGEEEKPPILRPAHAPLKIEHKGKTCPHAVKEIHPAGG